MDTDDSFEEFSRVAITGAAALSRAAEVLIRCAQDQRAQQAAETAQAAEQLQRRSEAQSAAAVAFYARAEKQDWVRNAPPAEVVMAWKGAQQWAELDPDRFAVHAARLNDQLFNQYGFNPSQRVGWGGLDEQARRCERKVASGRGLQAGPSGPAGATAAVNDAAPQAASAAPTTEARDARNRADYLIGCKPTDIVRAPRDSANQRTRTLTGPSVDQTSGRDRGQDR